MFTTDDGGEFVLDDGTIANATSVAATDAATLPFSRVELTDGAPLFVHFKVATSNRLTVLAVQQAVNEKLRGVRVSGHEVVCIVSPDNVEMTATDIAKIASFVVPQVKKSLGIP